MTTTTKDTIIAECCLDEGRPGKLMDTLTAARSRDPSVRKADVRDWLRKHGERLLGCGLTGGAYDVRKPETIIADAYEKSKADGNTTARYVHNRAKDLLSEHLHRQGLNKRESKVSAAETITFEDVREWLKKRGRRTEASPGRRSELIVKLVK